jgi:hypothetical protein
MKPACLLSPCLPPPSRTAVLRCSIPNRMAMVPTLRCSQRTYTHTSPIGLYGPPFGLSIALAWRVFVLGLAREHGQQKHISDASSRTRSRQHPKVKRGSSVEYRGRPSIETRRSEEEEEEALVTRLTMQGLGLRLSVGPCGAAVAGCALVFLLDVLLIC